MNFEDSFTYGFMDEISDLLEKEAGLKKKILAGAAALTIPIGGMLAGAHPKVTPFLRTTGQKIVSMVKGPETPAPPAVSTAGDVARSMAKSQIARSEAQSQAKWQADLASRAAKMREIEQRR